MKIENTINKVKGILLWIYIMAVLIGIVYAAYMGQETKTPGEIIYENTHTRYAGYSWHNTDKIKLCLNLWLTSESYHSVYP